MDTGSSFSYIADVADWMIVVSAVQLQWRWGQLCQQRVRLHKQAHNESASVNTESDSHLEFTAQRGATHSQCCQCGSCCISLCVTEESQVSFNFSNVNLLFLVCGNYTVSICWGDHSEMFNICSTVSQQGFPRILLSLQWQHELSNEWNAGSRIPWLCSTAVLILPVTDSKESQKGEKYMIVVIEFDLWISGHHCMT